MGRSNEQETMFHSELIQKISDENPHLYPQDIKAIVFTIFEEITAAVVRGDRVELRGFGVFSRRTRRGGKRRDPRTGETIYVKDKLVPHFKDSKLLRARLNEKQIHEV